jgi:cytosine permease
VGVVLTPDLTRYARNVRDCVTASFLGQGGGMTIAYVFGMIPVLVWNELEPMNYMIVMGFGAAALAVLVFATWTTNVINLYGVSLSARASVPVGNYRSMTIVGGIIGTVAAIIGIADFLIEFLIVMGLLVPPIAGVYLCDFFLLNRRDFSSRSFADRPAFKVNALLVGIGAGLVATWMYFNGSSLTSIAPLDSLVISVVAYLVLEKGSALVAK